MAICPDNNIHKMLDLLLTALLQGVTSPFDKVDDWMRAGAGFALLIDPYAEEYYVYDRKTWVEGRKESPRSLCNTEMLAPEPDLFPGLMISTNDILAVVRTAN